MKKLQAMFILALSCMTAFAAFATGKLYMVIDLSAGANAMSYPISYLDDVPAGGWTDEYKTTKLVLRRIEPGTCVVTVDKPYYIGVFEMTQKQYALIMGINPSYFSGEDRRPVECVSYNMLRGSDKGAQYPNSTDVDDDSFMGKLRMRTGLQFDIPNENQWEYACRAGTTTAYSYGNTASGDYMWYSANSESCTHTVGTRKPNTWGLFDIHGNVVEWCLEWYFSGRTRVFRGGAWDGDAICTSSFRGSQYPYCLSECYGFRLVRNLNNSSPGSTITFNANGSTNEIDAITIDVGEPIVDLPVIYRKGYVFLGWYTEKERGEQLCRGRELNGDITAYAHWVKESQIENATEQKGGFICVQYNSAFALNSISNALDCLNNAAAWTNAPVTKRYTTIALRANAREKSNEVSPYAMLPFPAFTDVSKDYSHVVLAVQGTIAIPEAGKWTFDCGHDDGFRTIIEGNNVSFLFEDGAPCAYKHTTTTFDFPVAGRYKVASIYYECTGGAEFDFSVAKGAHSSFDSSVFKLVGDPASGVTVVVGPDAPEFDPASGTIFEPPLSVAIRCPTEGATVHYTTDGSEPTEESPVYKRFRLFDKTTVKAIAIDQSGYESNVAVAEYALGMCDDPVISLADGTVFQHANQEVSISCGAEGTLRYTLDGTEPTTNSTVYAGPFAISESTAVKAKVFSDSYFDSQVVTANLTREWETVETPVITAGATFTGSREVVTITCGTDGAAIRYTLDGTEPTKDSPLYRGAFNVKESCTIKAKAFLEDYLDSEIVSVSVARVRGVGDVLGVPDVAFADGGALAWTEDANTSGALGGNSMKSGKITHLQESTLTATVTGKGTLSFYVKTSCEDSEGYYDWDRLKFTADGEMLLFDGECGWTNIVKTFTTDGSHTLTWTYIKDNAGSDGDDCAWLSNISWTRTDRDPLPEIGAGGSPAEVEDALDGVVDTRLKSRIVVGSDYVRFRNWSNKVGGDNFAHHQAIKDSPHAWLSYALDSAVLLTKAPEQGEMKVAAFERNAATGKFDFSVAIDGVSVGENATAENLATLLGVAGCAAVDGEFKADNVTFEFGTPVDGKVTISAEPNDKAATQFFLKVRMTP